MPSVLLGRYPPRYVAMITDEFPRVLEGLNFRGARYAPVIDSTGCYAGLIRLPMVAEALLGYYREGRLEELRSIRARSLTDNTIPPVKLSEITPSDIARIMVEHDTGGLAVVDDDSRVIGEITEKELIDVLSVIRPLGVKVSEIMTPNPATVEATEKLLRVLEVMCGRRVRRVPVTYQGELVGIVTIRDVIRYVNRVFEEKGHISNEDLEVEVWYVATPRLATVKLTDDASVAIKVMRSEGVGSVLVLDEESRLTGILTERDLIARVPEIGKMLEMASKTLVPAS